MDIQKVALIGAGSVGAYVLWGTENIDMTVLADAKRTNDLGSGGIVINGVCVHPKVKTFDEAEIYDLVILSTKYHALEEILPVLPKFVGKHTLVMSLLNGIDSEERIATVIPRENIVYSLIKITSKRLGNVIYFDPQKTPGIFYGIPDVGEKNEQLFALENFFAKTKLKTTFSKDILSLLWQKYALNISYNLPQAILGVGLGAYRDSEFVANIQRALATEVASVANSYGIYYDQNLLNLSNIDPEARYSTLQDLDAHRHTEIEMFLGVLLKKALAKGLALPFSHYTYNLIRALEEKNDGKFNY